MEPATDNARVAIQEYLASLAARAEKADRKTSQEQQARGGAGRRQPEVRPRRETRGRKAADTANIGISSTMTCPSNAAEHMERLTSRQTQTLILIAGGKTTQEIASALGISFKTAAAHRVRLMQRLGLHKSADVVRYAIRAGVVQP